MAGVAGVTGFAFGAFLSGFACFAMPYRLLVSDAGQRRLGDGRHLRQRRHAAGGGDGQGPQLPPLHQAHGGGGGGVDPGGTCGVEGGVTGFCMAAVPCYDGAQMERGRLPLPGPP